MSRAHIRCREYQVWKDCLRICNNSLRPSLGRRLRQAYAPRLKPLVTDLLPTLETTCDSFELLRLKPLVTALSPYVWSHL
jgi:hypothetical protein